MPKSEKRAHRTDSTIIKKVLTISALCLCTSLIPFSQAFAIDSDTLPSGATVVGGNVSFDYASPNTLNINQSTERAVINWDSFNIGVNALTQFNQISNSSIAINRVTGAHIDPTQILGTLKSNGRVVVLDRNGVIFGKDSVVDVGGIIASSGNIDDNPFLNGNTTLKITDANQGQIVLNGQMTIADSGLAAFVAPTIINSGTIDAKLGKVDLAGATNATLDLYGDGLIEIAVTDDLQKTFLENSGTINAADGRVTMTAIAAKKCVDSVINMAGIINVSSVSQKGGKIILSGDTINASGTLDASGKMGGGEILVGGDYQGSGTITHAKITNVTSTATLKANTTGNDGNGGKIVLWSDDITNFEGLIEAKGGSLSGNGGSVETSGKINLNVTGAVDASAINGANGEWLLDPSNVVISATTGASVPGAGGTVNPTTDSYSVLASSIQTALNNGNNVTITTTNASGTQSGDITKSGTVNIQKTSGASATLTLKADRTINLSGNTTIQASGAGNQLNIVLNADKDGDHDGAILMGAGTYITNGGYFVAGGGSGTLWGLDGIKGTVDDATSTGADNSYAWGNATNTYGVNFTGTQITTGAGDIFVNGMGKTSAGITVASSAAIQSTSGNIRMQGTSQTGTSNGLTVTGGASSIQTVSGSMIFNLGADGLDYQNGNILSTSGAMTFNTTKYSSSSTNGILNAGSGDIKIITDNFTNNLGSTTVTTGKLTLKSATPGTFISLGYGTTGLSLTDTELAYISAGTFIIGDAITGNNDITIDSWDNYNYGGIRNIELYGNDILFKDGTGTQGSSVDFKYDLLAYAKDVGADKSSLNVDNQIRRLGSGATISNLNLYSDSDISMQSSNSAATPPVPLNIVLNADRNSDHEGAIYSAYSTIYTNGGYFVAGGGSGKLFGTDGIYGTADDAASTGPDKEMAWGSSTLSTTGVGLYTAINAGVGNIIINGHGRNDIGTGVSAQSLTTSGSGGVYITGMGGGQSGSTSYNIGVTGNGTYTSGSGGINIIGTAGGSATSLGFNYGINGSLTLNGTSFLQGTGGLGIGTTNYGLAINNISSGNSTLVLTGIGGSNSEDILFDPYYIGNAGQTGDITINANTIHDGSYYYTDPDDGSISLQAITLTTSGTLTIKPRTASTSIGISGGTGSLNLSDLEFYNLAVGKLIIGDSTLGTGDILLDSWDLSGKTNNVELYGNDITLQDTSSAGYAVNLGTGDFKVVAKDNGADVADINTSSQIRKTIAGNSTLNIASDHNITFNSGSDISATTGSLNVLLNSDLNYATAAGGDILLSNLAVHTNGGTSNMAANGNSAITLSNVAMDGTFSNLIAGGALSYTSANDITLGSVQSSSVLVQTTAANKNITTNGQITATGANNAAVIIATGNFINEYGASLFNITGGGRWLVYSTNPTNNTRNSLTPNASAIYGGTYGTMAPNSVATGNRFIFSDTSGNAPTITFTADNKSKTYGDINSALTYTVGGFIDADNSSNAYTGGVVLSTLIDQTSSAGSHIGEINITNNSLTSNLGYQFILSNGNYNINRANLTIAANDISKTYGATKTFSGTEFSNTTLLNSDTISNVTLASTGAAGASTVAGGPYAIVASSATGTGLSNYNITYTNGLLTVDKANLLITADSSSKTYGSVKTFNGTEFTTGTLYNGDTVSSTSLSSSGTVSTATVAGGPYTINISSATGAGLDNYNISYADGLLTVDRANLLITAGSSSKIYGSSKVFSGTEFTSSALYNSDTVNSVTLSSAGAATAATAAGSPYAIIANNAIGTGLGNYNVSYANGGLTVDKANLLITANSAHKTYGVTTSFNGTEYTNGTLYNTDTITGLTITSDASDGNASVTGSPYAITASDAIGTGLENYNITYQDGAYTVNRANLTITANNAHKTYGATKTFSGTEFSNSTLLNSDTIANVTLASTGAAGASTVAGGPYAIVASSATGTGLSNYNITYTNGLLTVDKANLNINANNIDRAAGENFIFAGTEFTPSTLYNGNTVTHVNLSSLGAFDTSASGPYAITASAATGSGLDNYNITYSDGVMNVIDGYVPPAAAPVASLPAHVSNIINYISNLISIAVSNSENKSEKENLDSISTSATQKEANANHGASSCMVINELSGGCALH